MGATLLLLALLSAPRAEAAKKFDALTITPARPSDSQPLKVAWRPKSDWPGKGLSYQFEVATRTGSTCARRATYYLTRTWQVGDIVRGTLRPVGGVWCAGKVVVRLSASKAGSTTTLARQAVTIRNDPRTPAAGRDVAAESPITLTVLPTSVLTVRVPGRPDRSATLSGVMGGFIPGKFVPKADLIHNLRTSTVRVSPLSADPLCVAAPVPDPLALSVQEPPHSQLLVRSSNEAALSLTLAQDPLTLTGCRGTLPAVPRALLLRGNVGPAGLVNLELNGSLGGLRLSEGVDAEIVLKLFVKLGLNGGS